MLLEDLEYTNIKDSNALNHLINLKKINNTNPNVIKSLDVLNNSLPFCELRHKNIRKLEAGNTVVVATGQQVGLGGSPILTLYKALTAIKHAKEIEQNSKTACIPLFWVQSEDHDFDEISSATLQEANGNIKTISLPSSINKPKTSLAHININHEIDSVINEIREALETFQYRDFALNIFANHYHQGYSLPQAFTSMLAELTSGTGLIFFDPRLNNNSSLLLPIFLKAYEQSEEIYKRLEKRIELIKSRNEEPQVHIRKNSPLFFVHPENYTDRRLRIEKLDSKSYNLVGTSDTIENSTITTWLKSEPERFSTSALLRPIAQDSLFPVVAYVGGAAEEKYFAQIGSLYELFNLPAPGFIPRIQATILDKKMHGWLDDLGLTLYDLTLSSETILQNKVTDKLSNSLHPEVLAQSASTNIKSSLKAISEAFSSVDQNLLKPLEQTENKMNELIASLLTRYKKSIASKEEVLLQRIKRLQQSAFPSSLPQERIISTLSFLARYGENFIPNLVKEFENSVEKHLIISF
jgi:bacillithiol synthase